MKKHTRPLHCEKCPAAVAERRDLIRHYWTYHQDYARKHGFQSERSECAVCHRKFTRKDNLTRHVRKYHGVGGRKG